MSFFKKQSLANPQIKSSRSSLSEIMRYEQGARTNLEYSIRGAKQAIEAYYAISYIGFAVSLRANSVAKTDFIIQDKNENEITGTKVEALLRRPCGNTGFYHFAKAITSHILLDGNAFIWKAIDNAYGQLNGETTALIPFNPANVIIYDEMGTIINATTSRCGYKPARYEVITNKGQFSVLPDTIIQINAGSPVNLVRGMGIVQQNMSLLEADKIQDMFNKAFFERGAVANMVLSQRDDNILPKDYKQMADDFKWHYGAMKDPIMFAPPGTDIKELNLNYDNLQFIDLRRLSKENVMMMFRIPRSMAAMENQYIAKDEDKIAWEEVLDDDYRLIEDYLSLFVKEFEKNDSLFFRFKRKNTIAEKAKAETGAFLFDRGALSPRAYHQMVTGIVDETLSNDQYLGFNLMPISSIGQTPEVIPVEEEKPKEEEPEDDELEDDEAEKSVKCGCGHIHNKAMSPKARKLHETGLQIRAKTEQVIFKILKEYFRDVERRLIESNVKSVDGIIESEEAELIKANAKRFVTSAMTISINELNPILGTKIDPAFSRIKLVVEKLAEKYMTTTWENRLEDFRTIVQDALNAGGGADKIKQAIQEKFDKEYTGPNAWKSRRIARTEAMNSYNGASEECYKELGVQTVDIVGCIDDVTLDGEQYGCNSTGIPVDELSSINFHPNHTGTAIPSGF